MPAAGTRRRDGRTAVGSGYRMAAPAFMALAAGTAAAVEIDGRIDPQEWQGARHITDFRQVQPLTGAPGTLPTEAWILDTPEGLAIAIRSVQPAGVARTRQRVRRDFEDQVDRVDVMVDFDGDGRTGYDFTVSCSDGVYDAVVTDQNVFNSDWDGSWRHATGEDEQGWSAELLIPWYTAPMHRSADGTREVAVYLDRVVGSTGERMAWPAASFKRPRFLSEFARIRVGDHHQALLAVTPYVSGLYDNVRGRGQVQGGVDLFWKPSGQFQLTATVNPDFGQVESDDLVVNFSATETYVSDKRPFFTENQGLFEFTTPSDYSQLLYTRRIGGSADDGSGASDIAAAVKLNGSLGRTEYGLFLAEEQGQAGRSFRALRLVRGFDDQDLGLMLTQVRRPWLDRTASVLGVDHNWRPNARWNVRTRLIGSDIDQYGRHVRDSGATVWADYEMDRGWRQQWILMHFGSALELNDAGYLAQNSLNYAHWELRRRFPQQPADSRYSSKEWRWRISQVDNDHGERLNRQLRVSRDSSLRDGSEEYLQANFNDAGVDDLLTRGHGSVRQPFNVQLVYDYTRPRKGHWAHELEAIAWRGEIAYPEAVGWSVEYTASYFFSDALSVQAGLFGQRAPAWSIWQADNLVGVYDGREWHLNGGLTWNIGNRQELRVKLQLLAIDAQARSAYRVQPDTRALASGQAVADFGVRNLGLQLRYRYALAPMSDLYVVYARGGYREAAREDVGTLLHESLRLRDDEQLLVKFSYRFEL
ncbi:MAG: DUF5916 domain-containing protein [Pseudoxanthomonas sp.]